MPATVNPIDHITNLAKPKSERGSKARGFSYPLLGRAKDYTSSSGIKGFSLEFDDKNSAEDFLSMMCNLSDKKGKLIFPNLDIQNYNLVEVPSATPGAKPTFNVNIEAILNDELEEKIRSSNLAKSIERQKARQDSAAKGILATGFNIATLGLGVPVLGYASNFAGRALAAAERKVGWVPGLGFALRNGARALLDISAGVLQHGRSLIPSTSYNRSQARALERTSDDVGKAFPFGNAATDFVTSAAGAILKVPAFFTNLVADDLTSAATMLETRKAEEDKSTFYLRKFAANALKTLAFPFRAPDMLASWLLKSGENSLPTMHNAIDGFFKKTRFARRDKVRQEGESLPLEIVTPNLKFLEILAKQEGLVFDQLYEKNKSQTYYLATLAKVEVDGRAYEVLGDYRDSKVFYKYSGSIHESVDPNDLSKINAELGKIAATLPENPSKISKNGFSTFDANDEKNIKEALSAAIAKTTKDNAKNKSALTYTNDKGDSAVFDINTSKAFSIRIGSQVLTHENGIFGFSSHKQDLKMDSREFFNFLGNLSKGKAELTVYDGLPNASVEKPVVVNLKSGKDPKDKSSKNKVGFTVGNNL